MEHFIFLRKFESSKRRVFIFTRKFGTLDPYLPIVRDKVPNKTGFFRAPSLMINFAFQSGKEETGPSQKARHAQTVFVIVILNDFNLQCSASPSILTSILMFMLLIFVAVGPVLEIDYRGYRGRRTKDIWEDQKAGVPKNL